MLRKKVDVIIFGATGFTGKFVLEEFHRYASLPLKDASTGKAVPTFAAAGRSEQKLKGFLAFAYVCCRTNSWY